VRQENSKHVINRSQVASITLPENASSSVRSLRNAGLVCLAVYCTTLILDGVLRWFLDAKGAAALLYIRDLLPIVTIGLCMLTATSYWLLIWRSLMTIILSCFVFWMAWGTLHGIPLLQGLFGLKTLISIPIGVALALCAEGRNIAIAKYSLFAGSVALLGVVVDSFVDLPWAGHFYEIGDITVEGQRDWTIDGVARLAGFSRASFGVGSQLVVLSAIVLASGLWSSVRFAFAATALLGVVMTTSRASLAAFVVLLFVFFASRLFGRVSARGVVVPILWLPLVIVVVAYTFPATTDFVAGLGKAGAGSTASWALRTERNWLDALGMLPSGPSIQWLLGLGIGSAGAAQKVFEPDMYTSPDNLFIYLFVNCGLVGALLMFTAMASAWYHAMGDPRSRYVFLIPVVATAGIFISAIENVFLGMALGLALGEASLRRHTSGTPIPSSSPE
jgi:hypothetical protein